MRLRGEGLMRWGQIQANSVMFGVSCNVPITGKIAEVIARAYLAGANDALYDELTRHREIHAAIVDEQQRRLGIK